MNFEIKVTKNGFLYYHFTVKHIIFNLAEYSDNKELNYLFVSFIAVREDGIFASSGTNATQCDHLEIPSSNSDIGKVMDVIKNYLVELCK